MAWAAAMSPSMLCDVEAPVKIPTWKGRPASCSAMALLESSRKVALGTPLGVKPLSPMLSWSLIIAAASAAVNLVYAIFL